MINRRLNEWQRRHRTGSATIYRGALLLMAGLLATLPDAEHAALGARVGKLPGK